MAWPRGARVVVGLLAAGCAAQPEAGPAQRCAVEDHALTLPDGLAEASGAAWSRTHPGSFWSHNDSGGEPELFLVRGDGTGERLPVRGAVMRDWEDLAIAPCPHGDCLLVADIGDNGPDGPLTLYQLPEPPAGARWSTVAASYRAHFPDGRQRDAEAIFALPDGRIFLINKGNRHPIELYRWPTPLQADATLERVRQLAPRPEQPGDRVTGAAASPDGRYVAIRTYAMLAIYRTPELLAGGEPLARMDLAPLGEGLGEGVALDDSGRVVLVSESGGGRLPGSAALLSCDLP